VQNKKYQIFVSSTYKDLKDERKSIIENISKMGHLPVGMELFVASNDEQFEHIKKVIDNCDYYILVLGGRYGSVSPNTAISYTEMEYDYAIKRGLPVLVFPYSNIENLPMNKKDEDLVDIKVFHKKVSANRMCDLWENTDKLLSSVIIALNTIFSENPQRGWIRPDEFDNTSLLTELNSLRKENETLKSKIVEYEKPTLSSKEKLEVEVLKFVEEHKLESLDENSLNTLCDSKHHLEIIESLEDKGYISCGKVAKLIGGHYVIPAVHVTLDGKDYLKSCYQEKVSIK